MAKAKNFSNIPTGDIYAEQIAAATTPQAEPVSVPQKQERKRINLALQPDVAEFVSVMAGANGVSVTAYLNRVLAQLMVEQQDIYQQVKALRAACDGK